MVRIKHRYLLGTILYPGSGVSASGTAKSGSELEFLAFNQPTTDDLTASKLQKAIQDEVFSLFGEYGAGAVKASLQVKYLSPATSTFILRISRDHYRIIWAALTFMDEVPVRNGKKCVFRVVRVSGTIRKAEEEAIRRAREMILRAQREAEGGKGSTLEGIFGKSVKGEQGSREGRDAVMVDVTDGEDEEEVSDG